VSRKDFFFFFTPFPPFSRPFFRTFTERFTQFLTDRMVTLVSPLPLDPCKLLLAHFSGDCTGSGVAESASVLVYKSGPPPPISLKVFILVLC